ncbi:hypothetical protein [Cryobacterium sp. N19]|uniref:hypothetical protein n=1 Tax=Cryobacterium sp. N19 TaxID=2048288 RepID=UPI001124EB4D|nr:hypothetical protein [Cryobacterium sp. N19]
MARAEIVLPDGYAAFLGGLKRSGRCWTMLDDAEGEHVAHAWFIAANPWLGYDTPVTAIRDDRFKDAATATQAVIDDSFSG